MEMSYYMKGFFHFLPFGGVRGGLLLLIVFIASCSGNDSSDFYPNVVTEFATIRTDNSGTMTELTTDDERTYTISNPQSGYNRNAKYRAVCGIVFDGQSVRLYNATGAYLLRDSTKLACEPDAFGVVSVWLSGHFINMQLSPLTQGGTQYWGYRQDSVRGRTTHLSLHHRQNGDPLSYTQTVYASLPIDSLKSVPAGDSIALHFKSFKGDKVWLFKKP